MEQFKLKSIEELDLEFVNKINAPAAPVSEAKSDLIPEMEKPAPEETKAEETIGAQYFTKPAQPEAEEPAAEEAPKKKARPLIPIGQTPSPYTPVGAMPDKKEPIDFSESNFEVEDDKPKKKNKGALAGKIISIVLLCATVITFLFGCFITIFLDNNGTDIGGYCFNTMGQDIEALGVSKGDLIISQKVETNEYQVGNLIVVPSSMFEGCDIQSIRYVNPYSTGSVQMTTTSVSGAGLSNTVTSANCYGKVTSYVPVLGGLLSFAMENAILVCILFVLLAAFWCLLLVLIDKSAAKSNKSDEE